MTQDALPGKAQALPGSSLKEVRNWLAVWHTSGIGCCSFQTLLGCFGSPDRILSASRSELRQAGLAERTTEALLSPSWASVDQDLEWLEQPGRHIVLWQDEDYPALLREISDPPPVLYVHGNRAVFSSLQLAMVGSRNPTPSGARLAHDFAADLAAGGLTITSGLALGIDAAAHQGALAVSGATIAVAATGLDRVYPARHRDLASQIAEQGALVSEFPIGTRPVAGYFPRRNRIISGLSLGVLVVEAARKSGSLVTARLAMEQGREVFAIPGSIHNPLAKGCHRLIQQGAKLVESAQDIVEDLYPLAGVSTPDLEQIESVGDDGLSPAAGLDALAPDYQQLLKLIGFDPTSVDRLVEQSGFAAQEISSMLLVLELQGYVSSSPGGCYFRTASPQ